MSENVCTCLCGGVVVFYFNKAVLIVLVCVYVSEVSSLYTQSVVMCADCNFNVASMLKQSTFLTRLLERLESEPDKVTF